MTGLSRRSKEPDIVCAIAAQVRSIGLDLLRAVDVPYDTGPYGAFQVSVAGFSNVLQSFGGGVGVDAEGFVRSFRRAAAAPGEIVFTCSMGMYSGVIEVVQ